MKNYLLLLLCTLTLSLAWNTTLEAQCDPDVTPPDIDCINGLAVQLPDFGIVEVFAQDLVAQVTDECAVTIDLRIEMGQGDPEQGPPETTVVTFLTSGTYIVTIWAGDDSGNWGFCVTNVIVEDAFFNFKTIEGQVFLDGNEDCALTPGESGLENWLVQLNLLDAEPGFPTPVTQEFYTQADGTFSFRIDENTLDNTGSLELELVTSTGTGAICPSIITIDPEAFAEVDTLNYDLPVVLEPDCYAMQVDVSAPFLRRCFDNNYHVQYCNYGSVTAEDAFIEVTFDSFLMVNSSTLPWTSVDGYTYTFELGDVLPAECRTFQVSINVSCEALLGQTHCVEAHIFPDKPCPDNYAGPSLHVEGTCQEDEVEFKIINVGDGDMTEPVQYIVIEDVLMFDGGSVNLASGEEQFVSMPATGATYRLEAEQVAGHPGNSMPSAWVEGCTTGNPGDVSLGFVNQFPKNDADLFISIDCQENIGAYDPNDKQAFPRGVGEENGILQNVDLEYKIRFQNTGTDTAFNVVVLDTLSEWLDPSTVRPGASSHPYHFSMLEGHILKFSFDDIMLPDSNVNEPASNGYFKFRVAQKPDNPIGTEFFNSAAIYFDFNEPVITNNVRHTVVDHVIVVHADEGPNWKGIPVQVYPNPAGSLLTVSFEDDALQQGQWQLMDYAGSIIQTQSFRDHTFEVDLRNLTPGFYTYRLLGDSGRMLGSGKLVKE